MLKGNGFFIHQTMLVINIGNKTDVFLRRLTMKKKKEKQKTLSFPYASDIAASQEM